MCTVKLIASASVHDSVTVSVKVGYCISISCQIDPFAVFFHPVKPKTEFRLSLSLFFMRAHSRDDYIISDATVASSNGCSSSPSGYAPAPEPGARALLSAAHVARTDGSSSRRSFVRPTLGDAEKNERTASRWRMADRQNRGHRDRSLATLYIFSVARFLSL